MLEWRASSQTKSGEMPQSTRLPLAMRVEARMGLVAQSVFRIYPMLRAQC